MFIIVNTTTGEVVDMVREWYQADQIVHNTPNTKWEYWSIKMWCEL